MTILVVVAALSFAAILLIWIGYPLAVWGISRVASRPIRPDFTRPSSVSVIIATRERGALIESRIRNVLDTEQPSELLEVIVALDADGSPPDAAAITAIDPRVHVVTGDLPGGKACALNAGVRRATGELLVLTDVAQRFDRRTIPELVACLADERFGAVSGALSLEGRRSPVHRYWAFEKWLRYHEALVHSSVGVTGAVYCMRRALWPAVPEGTLLDDVYVPMRLVLAGHRIGFTYDARAYDARAFDANAEGVRKTRTLTGVMQLRTLVPGLLDPSRNPVVVQFLLHKYARLATPILSVVLGLSVGAMLSIYAWQGDPRVGLLVLAFLGLLLLVPAVRTRVIAVLQWVLAMQVATTRAIVNSVRKRWQVWNR